jgi:organic hydroperoxide reductase OsmC/OhrA
MSEHKARIAWKRATESFSYDDYNREHDWGFENGVVVRASSSPAFKGSPECVDPEEAFVASLSSCHMLTFLAICARKRIVVDSYEDDAVGHMEKNNGKMVISRVVLDPRITFAQGQEPSAEVLEKLHHMAHSECFLANSVKTEITVL